MEYQVLLREGIKYAPTLVTLIAIVIIFFRYLDRKDKRDKEDFDKRDKTITIIATQAFEVHKESNRVISENSKALGEMRQTMMDFKIK